MNVVVVSSSIKISLNIRKTYSEKIIECIQVLWYYWYESLKIYLLLAMLPIFIFGFCFSFFLSIVDRCRRHESIRSNLSLPSRIETESNFYVQQTSDTSWRFNLTWLDFKRDVTWEWEISSKLTQKLKGKEEISHIHHFFAYRQNIEINTNHHIMSFNNCCWLKYIFLEMMLSVNFSFLYNFFLNISWIIFVKITFDAQVKDSAAKQEWKCNVNFVPCGFGWMRYLGSFVLCQSWLKFHCVMNSTSRRWLGKI
jgi:hypothetical protein